MRLGSYLLWAAVATATGILVLLGYFVQLDAIPPEGWLQSIFQLRLLLMRWAVLLAGVALFVGLIHLMAVHWSKVSDQARGWGYSAIFLLAFLATLILGLIFGPDSAAVLLFFNYIQMPVETTLSALLAITLALAGFRLLSRRPDLISAIFIGTAFLVLLGSGPGLIPGGSMLDSFFGGLRNWLAQVSAAGGARGILLGVALGSIMTGLRVLLAMDRPYGDE